MMGRKITPRLQSMQRATSKITGGPGKPAAPGRGTLASSLGNAGKRVADMMARATPKKNGGMIKKKLASDMAGRALKRKTADAKGRAMKKGK